MGTRSSLAKLSREIYPGLEAIDQNIVSVDDANTFTGANIFSAKNTFSGGVLDSNVVEQSGTAAEDLTATAADVVWYANTAQAGAITLPDATAANVGMKIKIIVGTTSWSNTAFKLGFADSGTCVLVGQLYVSTLDGNDVEGFTITANAQSLEIDANDVTAAGGAIGSMYDFTYLEANLVHCMAYAMVTTGTAAPDAAASTTTGTS